MRNEIAMAKNKRSDAHSGQELEKREAVRGAGSLTSRLPNPGSPGGSSGSASLQRQREHSEEAEVSLSMKRELPGILSRCQRGNAGA